MNPHLLAGECDSSQSDGDTAQDSLRRGDSHVVRVSLVFAMQVISIADRRLSATGNVVNAGNLKRS
jgi:hypothetical protein